MLGAWDAIAQLAEDESDRHWPVLFAATETFTKTPVAPEGRDEASTSSHDQTGPAPFQTTGGESTFNAPPPSAPQLVPLHTSIAREAAFQRSVPSWPEQLVEAPAAGLPPIFNAPLALIVPFTSKVADGLVVCTPTFPPSRAKVVSPVVVNCA